MAESNPSQSLTEFLLARIAEDRKRADAMDEHYMPFEREWEWCPVVRPYELDDHDTIGPDAKCECTYPAKKRRALAECEAKRRIVEECILFDDASTSGAALGHRVLRALALPYANHSDYREELRP